MIEIEKYARAAASTARTPPNSPARRTALEAENTARVAAEQFAADQAQRIADLETKVDTLKRLHDAVADERDELRARLAEIEGQEPVAVIRTWHKSGEQHAGMADWCDLVDALPDGEHKLYARPVTAIQDGEQLTCDVCGVVCRDPWHYSAGDRRHMHACDSCWPGVNTAPEAAR